MRSREGRPVSNVLKNICANSHNALASTRNSTPRGHQPAGFFSPADSSRPATFQPTQPLDQLAREPLQLVTAVR